MIRAVVMICIALQLGGCADGAADFGRPIPVTLKTFNREITVSLDASHSSERRLRYNVDMFAQGNLQAVRARIVAPGVAQRAGMRRRLIVIGLDPARITESSAPSGRAPNVSIVLSRSVADTNDCAAAIALAFPDDPTPSLLNLSRCIQNNNLASMVADPADLVAPPPLGHADGAYLVNGVRSWRTNGQTQPPAASTSGGLDSGLSSSIGTSSIGTSTVSPSTPASIPNAPMPAQ